MQIYAVLKTDHKLVKSILKQLDQSNEQSTIRRLNLLKQLKEALVPHSRAEEQVLYDRLKKCDVKEADDLAFEGYEEHAVADHLLEELEKTAPNDKRWTALMSVAKEFLEHHIEEEEKEIFKRAKKALSRETAMIMAEEFEKMKAGFLKEIRQGHMPLQSPSYEIFNAA